jgi:hypothetical protein
LDSTASGLLLERKMHPIKQISAIGTVYISIFFIKEYLSIITIKGTLLFPKIELWKELITYKKAKKVRAFLAEKII